jgi:uncharacterized protein
MRAFLAAATFLLIVPVAHADYKVGDHLAKPKKEIAAEGPFKTTGWDALLPKGWDPMKNFRNADLAMMADGDPRAQEMLNQIQEAWEKAPSEPSLDGARIRIPGYIVPLEESKGQISEFLLVPYFGACIHVPPPPANQIIHVVADKPLKGFHMMDSVWVNGVLHTVRSENRAGMGMAASGYRMSAKAVEAYKP